MNELTATDIAFAELAGNYVARELHHIKTMIESGVKFYEKTMPRQVGKTRKLAEISRRLTEEGITNCIVVPTHSMVISTQHIYKNCKVRTIDNFCKCPLAAKVILVDEIYHCLYEMNVDIIRDFRQACSNAVIYGLGTPYSNHYINEQFNIRE